MYLRLREVSGEPKGAERVREEDLGLQSLPLGLHSPRMPQHLNYLFVVLTKPCIVSRGQHRGLAAQTTEHPGPSWGRTG
jgi:hypothetical protein